MSPEAAAVFAQVMPVLFIAVFVSEFRITKFKKVGRAAGITSLIALLLTPMALLFALTYVVNDRDMNIWGTWFVYLCTFALAMSMFVVAIEAFIGSAEAHSKADDDEDPEGE